MVLYSINNIKVFIIFYVNIIGFRESNSRFYKNIKFILVCMIIFCYLYLDILYFCFLNVFKFLIFNYNWLYDFRIIKEYF